MEFVTPPNKRMKLSAASVAEIAAEAAAKMDVIIMRNDNIGCNNHKISSTDSTAVDAGDVDSDNDGFWEDSKRAGHSSKHYSSAFTHNEKENPHKCSVCGKAYVHKRSLIRHQNDMSGACAMQPNIASQFADVNDGDDTVATELAATNNEPKLDVWASFRDDQIKLEKAMENKFKKMTFANQFLEYWDYNQIAMNGFPKYLVPYVEDIILESRKVAQVHYPVFVHLMLMFEKWHAMIKCPTSRSKIFFMYVDTILRENSNTWLDIMLCLTIIYKLRMHPLLLKFDPKLALDVCEYAIGKCEKWVANNGGWSTFVTLINKT